MEMRKKFAFILFSFVASLPVQLLSLTPPTEPEIQFAKRIVELWNDREAAIVLHQSQQFLHRYPETIFKDAILGIVAESHKYRYEYLDALCALNAIESEEYRKKTLIIRIDLLKKMGREHTAIKELQPHIPGIDEIPKNEESQLYTLCYADAMSGLAERTKDEEQKKQYQSIAYKHFTALKGTPFDRQALIGLATLYRCQGKHREATKVYLHLADVYLEHRDAHLYQAAKSQMEYNPDEAFYRLEEISLFNSKNQSERTVLKAKLLYDLNKTEDLITMNEVLRETVTKEHLPIIDYYLGISFFKEKDYNKAFTKLHGLVSSGFPSIPSSDTQKNTLLHLVAIKYHLNEPNQAEAFTKDYSRLFPDDEGVIMAHLSRGIYLLKNDMAYEALKHLEQMLKLYPDAKEIQQINYQRNIALMKLGDYQKAHHSLKLFLDKYPEHEENYQVHLLLAEAIDELGGNKTDYIAHLERALNLRSDMPQAARVHIKLFKAYATTNEENSNTDLLDCACDHLYTAFTLSKTKIPEDKRKWLANSYTAKLENRSIGNTYTHLFTDDDLETAERAARLYQSVGMTAKEKANLAKCCIWLGKENQSLDLTEEIKQSSDSSQSDLSLCTYLKGRFLESQGNQVAALKEYESILRKSNTSPFVKFSAQLQTARLAIATNPNNKPLIEDKCEKLKKIQFQKSLKTEPVHLEAALEYCFAKSKQAPTQEQEKTLLKLLKEMKSDFLSTDDISSRDYHFSMEQNVNRKKLFDNYILFIDSYIKMLEATESSSYKKTKIKNETAKKFLESIKQNKTGLTEYLENKVSLAIKKLDSK
ncbi:MAG: outer membrane protein assembly factor BamD [Chlamydiota bacterium]